MKNHGEGGQDNCVESLEGLRLGSRKGEGELLENMIVSNHRKRIVRVWSLGMNPKC